MSKKSRRARGSGRQPRLTAAQMVQPATAETPDKATRPGSKPELGDGQDLRAEYQYVLSDLRRIGVIAVAMLAILVVLAIVLM
jgi:hypothetical protein